MYRSGKEGKYVSGIQGICGYPTRRICQFITKENVRMCSINEQFIFFKTSSRISSKNGKVRSEWPRGLRRRSAAARLLRLWVRIPPGAWKFVCCECRMLSGRGLCDELINRQEQSYRLWCVVVCDLENLKNEEFMTRVGLQRHSKKRKWTLLPVPVAARSKA